MKFKSWNDGGDVINIGHIERIAVKRNNGRLPLSDVDILDTKLLCRLEIICRTPCRSAYSPWIRHAIPQCSSLTPFSLCFSDRACKSSRALGTVARVEGAVQDEAIRMAFFHYRIALGRV